MKSLDVDKLKDKKHIYVSIEEALKDVEPYTYNEAKTKCIDTEEDT